MAIQLALDEPRKNDTVVQAEEFSFFIDRFTSRYVDGTITLDYLDGQGFLLSDEQGIISRGITVYV